MSVWICKAHGRVGPTPCCQFAEREGSVSLISTTGVSTNPPSRAPTGGEREMSGTETPVTSAALVGEIRSRYCRPEWHVEEEVTLAGRRLDVVAFNLWGARAYRTVGFELKVSRGDWMRELADFQKSGEWTAVVDEFFVVAPGGIVRPEELPVGWGLLELRGSRMFTKAQPQVRRGTTLPREVVARFFDRILRRLSNVQAESDSKDRTVTREARDEIRAELMTELADRGHPELKRAQEKADKYDALIREFGLDSWYGDESIRRAIRLIKSNDAPMACERAMHDLRRAAKELSIAADSAERFAKELRPLSPPPPGEGRGP